MIKQLYKNILCSLTALVALTFTTSAATEWTVYPLYSGTLPKVIDTGKLVYVLNGGLFSYDPEQQEQQSFTTQNILSDNEIKNIYYNDESDCMVVAYTTGNIDVIYSDGSTKNIADIAITPISGKNINDVAFDGRDIMFVATDFGIVKINTSRGEVIESLIFKKSVTAIQVVDDKLLAFYDKAIHFADKNASIRSEANFTQISTVPNTCSKIYKVGENKIITVGTINNNDALKFIELDFTAPKMVRQATLSSILPTSIIDTATDGNLYANQQGTINRLNDDGTKTAVATLPQDYSHCGIGFASSPDKSLWCADITGIQNIQIADDGAVTVLVDKFTPHSVNTKQACFILPSPDGKKLHIYSTGVTSPYFPFITNFQPMQYSIMDIETETFENATPFPIEALTPPTIGNQKSYGKYVLGAAMIALPQSDPNTKYIATAWDGIYKITNGEYVGFYNNSNTNITSYYGANSFSAAFDNGGNLWVGSYAEGLSVLPADKVRLEPSEITTDDWLNIETSGYIGQAQQQILVCKKSNMIFATRRSGEGIVLLAYDTKGTYNDFSDDKFYAWKGLVDQDGKTYHDGYSVSLMEDRNGRVWFGTNKGIFVINNPSKATDPSMTVTHVKIPRNDGTNTAEYLLDGEIVYSISEDNLGRKWIGAERSGLVCLNAAGNEILATYNTDNSPLPDNRVISVWVNNANNDVFVGTRYGLLKLRASEESATNNFDDIYAYPNPVRPEYSGNIHIKGLMANSLVKIADAAGNVVNQGRAENGEYQWSGLDYSGSRVKSGVYFVFASQNTDGTTAAVTKILIMNN